MAENEKKEICNHCGKSLRLNNKATMVKDGKEFLLHKTCAKHLQVMELATQRQGLKGYGSVSFDEKDIYNDNVYGSVSFDEKDVYNDNVVDLKMPGGKDVFGPNKMKKTEPVMPGGGTQSEPVAMQPTVLQRDARVLREGLAKVFKMVPPPIQQEINNILSLYARNVSVYCQHPEMAFVPMRGCKVCIDCGAGDME